MPAQGWAQTSEAGAGRLVGLLWGGGQGDDAGPAAWTRRGGGEEPGSRREKAGQPRGSRPDAERREPGSLQRLLAAERRIASRRRSQKLRASPSARAQEVGREETSAPRGESCSPAHTSIYMQATHIDTRIDIHAHSYACRYTQIYTDTHMYTHHTEIHTDIHAHSCTCRYTHRYTQIFRYTHITHIDIRTDMHTATHVDTQTDLHR